MTNGSQINTLTKSSKTEESGEISKVVLLGASAGGLNALKVLISQLPKDFPLPVLVVNHISPDATDSILLLDELNELNTVKCQHAISGNSLKPGCLYLAPSDHHVFIGENQKILLTKKKLSPTGPGLLSILYFGQPL